MRLTFYPDRFWLTRHYLALSALVSVVIGVAAPGSLNYQLSPAGRLDQGPQPCPPTLRGWWAFLRLDFRRTVVVCDASQVHNRAINTTQPEKLKCPFKCTSRKRALAWHP